MISYIGGKSRIGKWINETAIDKVVENNNIKNYVEVFGGAFWTYFKSDVIFKSVNNIYYNDKNKFLVNLFYCVRYKKEELLKELKKYPSKNENIFNKFREKFFNKEKFVEQNFELGDIEVAVVYVYLQTHSFSGNYVTKNTKMVKDNTSNKYESFIKKLEGTSRSIKNFIEKVNSITSINNKDYKQVIEELDSKDTLFYLDPPYFSKERYYMFKDNFNTTEHKKLAEILNNIRGKFVLSYYYFKELEKLYPKDKFFYFKKEFVKSSSRKSKKDKSIEILITNFNPASVSSSVIISKDLRPANNTDYKNNIINKIS